MTIETERLQLVALNASLLEKLVYDLPALEGQLSCSYRAEPLEGHFLDIVKAQLEVSQAQPEQYMWTSFWLLIRKSDRVVVGSADFKAPPDEKGEVEIGYGLAKIFEKNGYMTEAVKAMCHWALRQESVCHVIAETLLESDASQRILTRCGFTVFSRGESLWWRL